jgi:hypothetical protein
MISFCYSIDPQEGFHPTTFIATPSGYRTIADICVGDFVYDHNFQEKIVTNTFDYQVEQYLQLDIQGHVIHCGMDQKLYLPGYDAWVAARDLTLSECESITIINDPCMMHAITLQDHIFCVSSSHIIAHNSAAAIAAPIIMFQFIQLGHPILILLGATTCLYYINSYSFFTKKDDAVTYHASQETLYFQTKYQQLISLKKECLSIHAAVKALAASALQKNYELLDCKPLYRYQNFENLQISPEYEFSLDFEQRLELTEIRQNILDALETQICDLQIAIGLFVDQIVSAKNETICEYNTYAEKNAVGMNKQAYFNGTNYTQAASFYEYVLICSTYMDLIEKRNKECSVLVEFFKKYGQNQFLLQTTTILPALTDVAKNVTESNKITDQTKKDLKVQLQSVHDYFYKTAAAPNISHKIENLHKDLQLTIQKKSTPQTFAYPKKTEQNDDDDDAPRWYEKSVKHPDYYTLEQAEKYLSRGISPSPQNGQEALDRSIKIMKTSNLSQASTARVTVENNYIVIFYRTHKLPQGGSVYHGFITTFHNLEKEQKQPLINKLIEFGLIKSNGKII